MDAGGRQGLRQQRQQQKMLPLFLCISIVTDALWGQKKICALCISSPCLYIPPLGYPLPMLREHFCVLLGCVTILFGETIEKKNVYLTYKSLSV